jgi:hypothetical protein
MTVLTAAMRMVDSPMNTGKVPRYMQPDFNPKGQGPRSQAAQMLAKQVNAPKPPMYMLSGPGR